MSIVEDAPIIEERFLDGAVVIAPRAAAPSTVGLAAEVTRRPLQAPMLLRETRSALSLGAVEAVALTMLLVFMGMVAAGWFAPAFG
jgi:hypothetical protein